MTTAACLMTLLVTAGFEPAVLSADLQLTQGQTPVRKRVVPPAARGSAGDGKVQRGLLAAALLLGSAGVSYWVYVDPTSVAAQPLTILSATVGGGSLFSLVAFVLVKNGPELGQLNKLFYSALAFIPGAIVGCIAGVLLSLHPPNRFPTTVTALAITNVAFVPLLFGLWEF